MEMQVDLLVQGGRLHSWGMIASWSSIQHVHVTQRIEQEAATYLDGTS